MAETKNSVKTFDPEEAKKIIEKLEKEGLRHVTGEVVISRHGMFSSVAMLSEKGLVMGVRSEDQPQGLFLLLSTHDLIQFLKEAFDLREKPD